MQNQKDPDSEPTIGENTADVWPDPTESGFNDVSTGDRSSAGGEVNEQDPSWRPGDDPSEVENSSAAGKK